MTFEEYEDYKRVFSVNKEVNIQLFLILIYRVTPR